MADCDLLERDLAFVIQACPETFDFALQFSHLIFGILPSCLMILAALTALLVAMPKKEDRDFPIEQDRAALKVNWFSRRLVGIAGYITIFFSQVTILVQWAITRQNAPTTALPSIVTSIVCTICLALLSWNHHRTANSPSAVIETALFFSSLFEAVQLRSYWLRTPELQALAITTSISLAARITTLVVESQPQKKRSARAISSGNISVEMTYGLFGQLSFWWLNPLFRFGFKSVIPLTGLWSVDTALSSQSLADAFNKARSSRIKATFLKRHSLALKCLRLCYAPLCAAAITRLGLLAAIFAQPFLIERVVSYLEHPSRGEIDEANIGRGLTGATAIIYVSIAITTVHSKHQVYRAITMTRGILVSAIYRKLFVLGTSSNDLLGAMTLMSTDVERIGTGLQEILDVWASLLGTIIGCTVLALFVGLGVLIPMFLVLVSFVGTMFLMGPYGRAQVMWNEAIQERVNVIASMLTSMKFVKMCGLSSKLESVIQNYRITELDKSKRMRKFTVIVNFSMGMPVFLSPVIVLTMLWAKRPDDFTVSNALATLAIVLLLADNLSRFLAAITHLRMSFACFGRIQNFLDLPEKYEVHSPQMTRDAEKISIAFDAKSAHKMVELRIRSTNSSSSTVDTQSKIPSAQNLGAAMSSIIGHYGTLIVFENGIVASTCSGFELRNVNLRVQASTVTMLIGPVASGKSLLLKTLIDEVELRSGKLTNSAGGMAYCSQSPFIWKASLRDNILGESAWDQQWYETVLEACELYAVVGQLQHGDATSVGNHGSMLSGGQQQRVALARALYARQPLLVLDDPLSGLDRNTQALILERIFGVYGLCRKHGFTIIMATSNTSHVAFADQVVALDSTGTSSRTLDPVEIIQEISPTSSRTLDDATHDVTSSNPPAEHMSKVCPAEEDEENMNKSRGSGDIQLYTRYIRSMGYICSATFFFLCVLYVFFMIFPAKWLQLWARSHQQNRITTNHTMYITVYGLSAVLGLLVLCATIGYWFIYAVPRSAKSLHLTLLQTVMRAPYMWLLTTNTGKTLNRFSQDMSLIDLTLPLATELTLVSALNCIGSLVFVVMGSVWLAAAIPAVLIVLYVVQSVYLRTSRQLRLLDLEAKSPLYTHFGETIDGLATIRAYGWQSRYIQRGTQLLDRSQSPFYLLYCAQRWLNFVLYMMVAGIATLLVGVGLALKGTSSSDSGSIGVALINVIAFNQHLALLVQNWTIMETSLGAIARVADMVKNTPVEAQPGEDLDYPLELCGHAPSIDFQNVCAKAAPEDPQSILNNVSLHIPAGSKTAIVGPSGSGKSSLLLVLTRMLHLHSGAILLGGTDIAGIKRDALRQQIAVMSQAAPALPGTVRFNLDPLGLVNDTQVIMTALAKVGLAAKVHAKGGLIESFAHLSLSEGEKQLFRFAAVLLSSAKLVVLDEVTSNMDAETEKTIMKLIEEELRGRTIISVAHRLDTILGYDQVIVVENGTIAESGRPRKLLGRVGTRFRRLYSG